MHNLSIIIPVAGCGYRMKSYGPKCLLPINGRPLINRQIDILQRKFPGSEIIVIYGFNKSLVAKALPSDITVCENDIFDKTNVAYSLLLGLETASYENVLIVYGDLVFTEKMFDKLNFANSFAICAKMRKNEVGIIANEDYVCDFNYSAKNKWSQICFLLEQEKELFIDYANKKYAERYFGFEILNGVINNGGVLKVIYKNDNIVEIDSSKDIYDAQRVGMV
jgi:choline kinase